MNRDSTREARLENLLDEVEAMFEIMYDHGLLSNDQWILWKDIQEETREDTEHQNTATTSISLGTSR